ncbi:AMP-binding protein [Mycobacterium syngnathidarum]
MPTRTAHVDTFCRDRFPPAEYSPDVVFDLPALNYPQRINCAEALLDTAVSTLGPDRTSVLSASHTWSYDELLNRANQIAHVLSEDYGLVPGNRVLLRGTNTAWTLACWFAVVKAGGVVVTTMPLLRTAELVKLIALTAPAVALCDHRLVDELSAAAPDLPIAAFGGEAIDDLQARSSTKPINYLNCDTAADDVALLAVTSGTTGSPKATMHLHRDVLAIADTFSAHVLRPGLDDIFVGTPPLAFTFGLGALAIFPTRVGAAVALPTDNSPAALLDVIEQSSATILFTAPTAYKALLKRRDLDRLGSLRRCVSAGEHLPAAVFERFRERTGLSIINGIGSTEMLHVFIAAADEDIRAGATGRIVPGYRAEIQDAAGAPVPDGQPGQLAVKGPTGCRYLADLRQRDYVRNGWNITGDTYIRDDDGYFWFCARTDDMIVSSGYNISPVEVEGVLDEHPDVVESGVTAAPDDDRGAIVRAAVVLRPGIPATPATARRLQDYCKQVAAPYKYPRRIDFVDQLPRNASGKLQRYKLRELWHDAPQVTAGG